MKLNSKTYKTNKTKNFIKTNGFFFIFNGTNRKATDWIVTEQELINVHFEYYKIFNKIASKTFINSKFKNFKSTINSITFFINPSLNNTTLKKHVLINNFESLLFKLLAIKLNNKIYSAKQLNKLYVMTYRDNKILLYQFGIANLKIHLSQKM
jgi:endo-1,4-beta-mannosidase